MNSPTSHAGADSWRTPRKEKHGALLLHFNAVAAIMAVWLSFSFVTLLEWKGVIPMAIPIILTMPYLNGPWVQSGMPQVTD